MQKLLTLIITIAILYSIIHIKMQEPEKDSSASHETKIPEKDEDEEKPKVTGSFLEKTLSSVLINILKTEQGRLFFENIIQPANKPIAGPDYTFKLNNTDLIKSMFQIASFGQGTGGSISCGHIVTAEYKILDIENNILDDQTKTFTLGSKGSIQSLNLVMPGMKLGETRQATLPAEYSYQDKQDSIQGLAHYKVSVTLNSFIPQTFIYDTDVKIFDDEISYKAPLVCGHNVNFDAKITRLSNGNVVYDSEALKQKISMNIGNLTFPMIFSYALHGKVPVGTRTVIAKGQTFKSLGSVKINKIFPKEQLPDDEFFMLEIKNFD